MQSATWGKREKSLKSATNSEKKFMESAKREYNRGVTKKKQHLEETYPVLLLNEEWNSLNYLVLGVCRSQWA